MTGTYTHSTRKRGLAGKHYVRICAGTSRGEYAHTLIAEAMLGRELREHECVDHRDGDGLNPQPWNLRVVTIIGNSRKKTPPLKGEVIFDGAQYWKDRNPDWVDPLGLV